MEGRQGGGERGEGGEGGEGVGLEAGAQAPTPGAQGAWLRGLEPTEPIIAPAPDARKVHLQHDRCRSRAGQWANGLMGGWATGPSSRARACALEEGRGWSWAQRFAPGRRCAIGRLRHVRLSQIEGVCSWCRRARCVSHTRSQSGVIAARAASGNPAKSRPGQRLARPPSANNP